MDADERTAADEPSSDDAAQVNDGTPEGEADSESGLEETTSAGSDKPLPSVETTIEELDRLLNIIEEVDRLLEISLANLSALRGQFATHDASLETGDVESLAEQLNKSAQDVLQQLDTQSNRLRQAVGLSDPSLRVGRLVSGLRSEMNDALVQLVVLDVDESSLADSMATLTATIDSITDHYRATRSQLDEAAATAVAG
ncbi:MAG: hypothetical protein O3C40_02395 [Planctomycetota bacterium]|nr:hypothetical protein [Planctomycetota bacterium]